MCCYGVSSFIIVPVSSPISGTFLIRPTGSVIVIVSLMINGHASCWFSTFPAMAVHGSGSAAVVVEHTTFVPLCYRIDRHGSIVVSVSVSRIARCSPFFA